MPTTRRLVPAEWPAAFPLIAQLRTLDEPDFLACVRRQSFSGYELVGAFHDDRLVGIMGMRPVHTLARGPHLHIDDLVVDQTLRSGGIGRALIAFAEADAEARGMLSIFLDARQDAIAFYERLEFGFHTAPSMTKPVGARA